MRRFFGTLFGAALLFGSHVAPVFANQDESLSGWYNALQNADVSALEGAMAAEDFSPFEYKVTDLGIEQNRSEFIASMDEWLGAISGGSIDYKIKEEFEGGFTVSVCYRFKDSEFLAEEEVGVYDTKITGVSQTGKGNTCAGF